MAIGVTKRKEEGMKLSFLVSESKDHIQDLQLLP
jgi:hypothetical protein